MRDLVMPDRGERMRVLGIDPGLTRCGLGVVDGLPGRQPQLIAVDVVRTPPDLDTARRLVLIEQTVDAWITEHRPTAVAIERVFAQHNVQTVMGTAQAAGVAMLVAARRGIAVTCTPRARSRRRSPAPAGPPRTRSAPWSAGSSGWTRRPRPADAADALALAICHVWRGGTTARLDAAMEAAAAQSARQHHAFRNAGRPVRGSPATPAQRRAAT